MNEITCDHEINPLGLILLRVDHAIMPLHTMSAVFLANLVSNKLNRKKKYPENEASISFLFRPCSVSVLRAWWIYPKIQVPFEYAVVVGQIFRSCFDNKTQNCSCISSHTQLVL